jgi:hypothetical protein
MVEVVLKLPQYMEQEEEEEQVQQEQMELLHKVDQEE